MRPIDVDNKNDTALYRKLRAKLIAKKGYRKYTPKYRVGDLVRIPRTDLGKHAKGAVAKWTEDLYKIIKVDTNQNIPDLIVLKNDSSISLYKNIDYSKYCKVDNFNELKIFALNKFKMCENN